MISCAAMLILVGSLHAVADQQTGHTLTARPRPERATASLAAELRSASELEWIVEVANASGRDSKLDVREVAVDVRSEDRPILSAPEGWLRRVTPLTGGGGPVQEIICPDCRGWTVAWTAKPSSRGVLPGEVFIGHFRTGPEGAGVRCGVTFRNGRRLVFQGQELFKSDGGAAER
jgi:hypothetical protein